MNGPALVLQGLRKTYKGHLSLTSREVIRGLDLTVEPGEVFGLLGQNGAGKTTTLKLILSLIFPDAGVIRLFGEESSRVAVRSRIGFLPENPFFYDYLTGREFLDFYGQLFGFDRAARQARAAAILDRVGMASRADLPLRKYSKGMLQRIGMAQALLNDPDLVILDEPMSGLDPIGRREFRDIILELKGRGKTVFFSSHILSDAEAICDRIGILKDGRLARCGRLPELLPPDVRSWEVAFAGPAWETLAARGARAERISTRGSETLVKVAGPAELEGLLDALRSAGARLIAVTPRRDTLEDLYLREVGGR
ncbi:MAG TPA: ABC transporter ATP-binding protein [Candidatus Polarisedimenticolia bacterium]|nr:ABC transporter ATP-binding protein [Candidatus Polarisedimenticolia bacterium]